MSSFRFSSSVVRLTSIHLDVVGDVSLRPSSNSLNSLTWSSACCRPQFASSQTAFAAPSVSANFALVSARSSLASFVPRLLVTVLGSSPFVPLVSLGEGRGVPSHLVN